MDNDLSFSTQYFSRILKAYNLEKCKPSTIPGNKKPFIAAEPLDKKQHSICERSIKELSRSLQQPDNEDWKSLKQMLRYIKEKNEIQINIESFADSDRAGCNSTRKSTNGAMTSCWGTSNSCPKINNQLDYCHIKISSGYPALINIGLACKL
eukprot:6462863-Amphidinium_carterae.2